MVDKKKVRKAVGQESLDRVHSGLLGYIVSLFEADDNGQLKIAKLISGIKTWRQAVALLVTILVVFGAAGALVWLLI